MKTLVNFHIMFLTYHTMHRKEDLFTAFRTEITVALWIRQCKKFYLFMFSECHIEHTYVELLWSKPDFKADWSKPKMGSIQIVHNGENKVQDFKSHSGAMVMGGEAFSSTAYLPPTPPPSQPSSISDMGHQKPIVRKRGLVAKFLRVVSHRNRARAASLYLLDLWVINSCPPPNFILYMLADLYLSK